MSRLRCASKGRYLRLIGGRARRCVRSAAAGLGVGLGGGSGAVRVPSGSAVVALDFVALRSPQPVASAAHSMRTAVDDLVRTLHSYTVLTCVWHGRSVTAAPQDRKDGP